MHWKRAAWGEELKRRKASQCQLVAGEERGAHCIRAFDRTARERQLGEVKKEEERTGGVPRTSLQAQL